MRLTTENSIGHILFKSSDEAEVFAVEMADMADVDESFEVQPYQGNRFHAARFYGGKFEAYC
jgi:hypothetical protein